MTSVKCAIRVRPFSPKETMDKTKNIIEMSGPTTTITDPSWFERKENLDAITAEDTEYLYKKSFTFDHSFSLVLVFFSRLNQGSCRIHWI